MIEQYKDKYFPVLDHGFCALVDYMGDDKAIARAARCSYGSGTKAVSSDRGLIRTLMRDHHTSPFEMCEIVLHVGLPIFVARQWIRHRTASLNEYSGRYSVMPTLFYTPEPNRLQKQNQDNKQGSSTNVIEGSELYEISGLRNRGRSHAKALYHRSLDYDMARELARIDLPLSTYTYWYWKIDLKNLLHFLKLRLDEHAQYEIRVYAEVIAGLVQAWLPAVWEAFEDYSLYGVQFSRQEQYLLAKKLVGDDHDLVEDISRLGMSKRESSSFYRKINNLVSPAEHKDFSLNLDDAKTSQYYENKISEASK